MSRPRILFVTYYRLVPTGQIGVFKRCIRLFRYLDADYEIHLVNYGPFPEDDGVVAAVRDRMVVHHMPELELGEELWELFGDLAPDVVVLGETPLRGNMRLSYRVGLQRGVPQIAFDNLYAPRASRFLHRIVPGVDRFLLLGLGPDGELADGSATMENVPPLVSVRGPVTDSTRNRVCLIGYDEATLVSGLELMNHLPNTIGLDILTVPAWRHIVDGHRQIRTRDTRVHVYPDDEQVYEAMSQAQVLFGKAGFQQVVEGLMLGARVVCRRAGGGIDPYLLPDYLEPYVSFLDNDAHIPDLAAELTPWFEQHAVGAWLSLVQKHPNTMAYVARRLSATIEAIR